MGFFKRKVSSAIHIEAEKVYAADLTAETAEQYLSRGLAYHHEGNQEKAEEDTRKALSLDPDNADAFYNLGLIYKSLGKTAEARQAFEQASARLEKMRKEFPDRAVMVERLIRWHLVQIGM